MIARLFPVGHIRSPGIVQHIGTCYTCTGYTYYYIFTMTLFGIQLEMIKFSQTPHPIRFHVWNIKWQWRKLGYDTWHCLQLCVARSCCLGQYTTSKSTLFGFPVFHIFPDPSHQFYVMVQIGVSGITNVLICSICGYYHLCVIPCCTRQPHIEGDHLDFRSNHQQPLFHVLVIQYCDKYNILCMC